MFLAMLLAFNAHSATNEVEIVATFKKAPAIYKKFHRDTIKYRDEVESYNENEFEPAVEKMILLLGQGKCENCLQDYLRGLSYLENSASEKLNEQLMQIISAYPKKLNSECKKSDNKMHSRLLTFFREAVRLSMGSKRSSDKNIENDIANCLK